MNQWPRKWVLPAAVAVVVLLAVVGLQRGLAVSRSDSEGEEEAAAARRGGAGSATTFDPKIVKQRLKAGSWIYRVASNAQWESGIVDRFIGLGDDEACAEDVVTIIVIKSNKDLESVERAKSKSCSLSPPALAFLSPDSSLLSDISSLVPRTWPVLGRVPTASFRYATDIMLPIAKQREERLQPPPIFPLMRKIKIACFDASVSASCTVVTSRADLLSSTFVLVSASAPESLSWDVRRALSAGAVPVVVADALFTHLLPFAEVIDWSKAVVSANRAVLTRLLSPERLWLSEPELFSLRRQGKRIFTSYLASDDLLLDTASAVLRHRRGIQPPLYWDVPALDAIKAVPMKQAVDGASPEQGVSPSEIYFAWNTAFFPWRRSPVQAEFVSASSPESSFVQLVRGSDKTPARKAEEAFTVVVMTFRRIELLPDLLKMLSQLENLDSVVLLWNDVSEVVPPAVKDLLAKYSGLKVKLVRPPENSLNNRMMPFDVIETDAILQIDDDTRSLTPALVAHGFAVWRQNRHRLVGYMARDARQPKSDSDKWQYVTAKICTQSMVLTTAVFHHKYYLYRYMFELPRPLLSKVKELMNCEDIFFNAMAQDLTDSSPVMAASWTDKYSCGNSCKLNASSSISRHAGHYETRSSCLDILITHFGYLPLIPSGHYGESLKREGCYADTIV